MNKLKRIYTYIKANKAAGFTLIELLVVIAIIGILSSIVLASLNEARGEARDARRQSDLDQIQLALAQLHFECDRYPQTAAPVSSEDDITITASNCKSGEEASLSDFMSQIPSDPKGGGYGYASSETQSFCLTSSMEGSSAPDDSSGGSTAVCSAAINAMTASNSGATYTIHFD